MITSSRPLFVVYIPIVPETGRLRQEEHTFEARLGNTDTVKREGGVAVGWRGEMGGKVKEGKS